MPNPKYQGMSEHQLIWSFSAPILADCFPRALADDVGTAEQWFDPFPNFGMHLLD